MALSKFSLAFFPTRHCRWGSLQVDPRLGDVRYMLRLRVHPPGTTRAMRGLLVLWAVVTGWRAAAYQGAFTLLVWSVLGPELAAGYVALVLALIVILGIATRRARAATRSISATVTRGQDPRTHTEVRLATALDAIAFLDDSDTGDPVAYEAVWGRIYHDILGPEPDQPRRQAP